MPEREHAAAASILTASMIAAFALGCFCGAAWVFVQAGV